MKRAMKLHPWCREYRRSALLELVDLIHIQGDVILTHGKVFEFQRKMVEGHHYYWFWEVKLIKKTEFLAVTTVNGPGRPR